MLDVERTFWFRIVPYGVFPSSIFNFTIALGLFRAVISFSSSSSSPFLSEFRLVFVLGLGGAFGGGEDVVEIELVVRRHELDVEVARSPRIGRGSDGRGRRGEPKKDVLFVRTK